ncbi:MAG TPA: protein-methionine-sulfoxide reductase heme-binding subunit MsrQ [Blastocatellia bacterium]|nr:protein-methionine-sulfoxide reductase heme-binding subunit MsrQ [Blastocatellia bacterium]HMX27229.1 protein-methionine-sulfoxide reductase heme-binding subunit MsrQ [Blastocatellia bacterium]HMY70369.1 protein-methionine-sulfoxide reductase heme-binding subunit MsrQ [Blastocatellia bacterium]HMZ18567.1 protein-methionine-sulfoxide reductase heme-binding subunit MsrQ [Blastocatellia bacterium]HNG28132.1 protein-methionine-sulfoxide reductase heme-binding subunit MsrQ [Blastocatellia bacteri
MPDVKFAKLVVFINAAVPCSLLLWDAYHHRLGANPQEFALHTTGTLTLVFLLLSLAVTPLRKVLGLPWMVQFRRLLGLFAFFYGCLHLLAYTWFDKGFGFRAIVDDTLKRPFIFLGMFSFLVMVPLAVTSTSKMIKRMGGRRWNLLHRTVYLAAIAGVLHYYLLVKADVRLPLAFAVVLALLLAYRMLNKFFPAATERRPKRAPSLSRN